MSAYFTDDQYEAMRQERARRLRQGEVTSPRATPSLLAEAAKIGIDVSHYQERLVESALAGNVQWIAAKMGECDDRFRSYSGGAPWNKNMAVDAWVDDKFADHCQTAYNIKARFCAYFFDNPAIPMSFYASGFADHAKNPNDGDPRILTMRQALKNKEYHAICLDAERWWLYYTEYLEYIMGTRTSANVQKLSPIWIYNSTLDLYQRVKEDMAAGKLKTVPIWIYTGKWFVDAYCPQLDTVMADKLQWLADYTTPVYSATKGATTWEKVRSSIQSTAFNPKWIGNKRAEALQLTDAAIPGGITNAAGVQKPVDVDVLLAEMDLMFAKPSWATTPTTPDPEPEEPEEPETPTTPSADLAAVLVKLAAIEKTVNEIRAIYK